jgi:hypothetical protein
MKIDIENEVDALRAMTTGQLRERYAELFGEAARTRHKAYLIRRIAWRLQANAEGDLSERARQRAAELANDAEVRVTPPRCTPTIRHLNSNTTAHYPSSDPRLPIPGAVLVRQYKGRTIRVLVQSDGFECDGQRYKSLTAVTKAVTGSHRNGYLFFRLGGKP